MSANHIANLELVKLSAVAKADGEASVSTKNSHNTMRHPSRDINVKCRRKTVCSCVLLVKKVKNEL